MLPVKLLRPRSSVSSLSSLLSWGGIAPLNPLSRRFNLVTRFGLRPVSTPSHSAIGTDSLQLRSAPPDRVSITDRSVSQSDARPSLDSEPGCTAPLKHLDAGVGVGAGVAVGVGVGVLVGVGVGAGVAVGVGVGVRGVVGVDVGAGVGVLVGMAVGKGVGAPIGELGGSGMAVGSASSSHAHSRMAAARHSKPAQADRCTALRQPVRLLGAAIMVDNFFTAFGALPGLTLHLGNGLLSCHCQRQRERGCTLGQPYHRTRRRPQRQATVAL